MVKAKRFRIIYHSRLKEHLQAIDRKYHTLIRQTIDAQLSFEANVETRNRKPIHEPLLYESTWELRFGPRNRFRVFYDVSRSQRKVDVLAIGEKEGNRLFIGGEEIKS